MSATRTLEAMAATAFVASVAVGWIVVTSTVTAPLLAAGAFLSRASNARPAA